MKKENDIRIDLNKIHPWLKYKLLNLIDKCNEKGIYLIITEGFRTVAYQNSLYAKGRTTSGNIVTNAKGNEYKSQHQWGIAFDIAINDSDLYNMNYIKKVADIAKSNAIGLGWGGDWKSFSDYPHFYLKDWGSTTSILRSKYGTPSMFKKTWSAKVTRKNGVYIWNKTRTKKKKLLKYNSAVKIMWKHKIWAKVEYKDITGYVKCKYLQ